MKVTITSGKPKNITVTAPQGVTATIAKTPKNWVILEKYRNGLSAYEVAVNNGFAGTEAEFVAGLTDPDTDFLAHYILSKN